MVTSAYSMEMDETGAWCTRCDLEAFGIAYGEGDTRDEALADLDRGVALVAADEGVAPPPPTHGRSARQRSSTNSGPVIWPPFPW